MRFRSIYTGYTQRIRMCKLEARTRTKFAEMRCGSNVATDISGDAVGAKVCRST